MEYLRNIFRKIGQTSRNAELKANLSKVRIGMKVEDLIQAVGHPQFSMPQSAAFGAFGTTIGVIPEEVMKRENWVYNTPLGQFQVVVQAGIVVEVQGVNSILMK